MSRDRKGTSATPLNPVALPGSPTRCEWCLGHPLYVAYHDQEWGVPEHDDQRLFEKLILDGAQAGLSWLTILKKREGYRRAFDGFDAERMARYGPRQVAALLADPGIVRNRLKVAAAITNARAYLDLRAAVGSFDHFLWQFVGGVPRHNHWRTLAALPARTPESDALSRALQERGFKFVGSTIVYAFMQAVGMVNDHLVTCFRYRQLSGIT
jgi:DNA-3-methyladenine glycosylase I